MEIAINQALQRLSCTFLDYFNLFITQFGDELFFIILAVIFYWCVDKRFGYKLINVYIFGVAICDGLKNLIKRPRPYTYDEVTSIGPKTQGYSFPSGHSHTISNLMTQVNIRYKFNIKLLIPSILLVLLVLVSRLYLGQHFLTDVLVGSILGIGFAVGFSYLFELLKDKEEKIMFVVFPICVILSIACFFIKNVELASNILKVTGGYGAVTVGYYIEKRWVKCPVKTVLWKNIIKVVIGIILVLLAKEGLKYIFPSDILFLSAYLRYFIVGMIASVGCFYLYKLLKLY